MTCASAEAKFPPSSKGGPSGHKYTRMVLSYINANTQMPSVAPLTWSCSTTGGGGTSSSSVADGAGSGGTCTQHDADKSKPPNAFFTTLKPNIRGVLRPTMKSFWAGGVGAGASCWSSGVGLGPYLPSDDNATPNTASFSGKACFCAMMSWVFVSTMQTSPRLVPKARREVRRGSTCAQVTEPVRATTLEGRTSGNPYSYSSDFLRVSTSRTWSPTSRRMSSTILLIAR
mmetsp:Transcript_1847/g.3855  ORF Transcript_1847/g.3855 Transcript_1847/m.3855 type:complete len:229 (-) Transcript_1847:176-862(-)